MPRSVCRLPTGSWLTERWMEYEQLEYSMGLSAVIFEL